MILRIEDLDRQRCKPEYDAALFEDLRWAGLAWSEGPDIGGPFGPYRQSERAGFYLSAWRKLAEAGMIYACTCTRRDVERAARAPHAGEHASIYPGCCRPRLPTVPAGTREGINWRFRTNPGEVIEFDDGAAGGQTFTAGQDFGDFIVWRKDGVPAYQLAVVVDDATMRISEVVRGEDLLMSTAQQLLVYRALDLTEPQFFHVPLVTDENGARLAKRAGSQSLRAMRLAGARMPGRI